MASRMAYLLDAFFWVRFLFLAKRREIEELLRHVLIKEDGADGSGTVVRPFSKRR